MITDDIISRVRSEIPIASVISVLQEEQIPIGQDAQVRCTLHGPDKNPSAKIYSDSNIVKCWACAGGRSRDTIQYVKEFNKCSFKEAVLFLAKTFLNIDLDEPKKIQETEKILDDSIDLYIDRKLENLNKALKSIRRSLTLDTYTRCWAVYDYLRFERRSQPCQIDKDKQLDLIAKIEDKVKKEVLENGKKSSV